jgi:hypothetical protein
LEEEIASYKGFLFVKDKTENAKRETKFKNEVDLFCDTVAKHYDELRTQEFTVSAETRAQAILMRIMPDYGIIRVDDGSASSQIDLKAISRVKKHSIAIEVTQHTNNNLNRKKDPERIDDCRKLNRDWTLHVNNNVSEQIDIEYTKKVCSLLIQIEQKYAIDDTISIDANIPETNNLLEPFIKLNELNIFSIYSKKSNSTGSIQYCIHEHYFPNDIKNEAPKKILEIAYNECVKDDNQDKLKKSGMNEKHLFITILSDHEKEKYFEALVNQPASFDQTVSIPEEIDGLKEYSAIFDTADVVWIEYATFDATGKVVSSLIKITKKDDKFVFSLTYNKEPYIQEIKDENPICRL